LIAFKAFQGGFKMARRPLKVLEDLFFLFPLYFSKIEGINS